MNTTNYDESDAIDVTYKDSPATTVYVNDDWTSQTLVDNDDDTLIWLWDAFKTIQEGVDAVAEGSTSSVNVYAGTTGIYNEDIVIDKTLELLPYEAPSKAYDDVTIKGVDTVVNSSWPLADPNIEILADNVKIHNFSIKPPDYVSGYYSSGIVVGGSNFELYNNFITGNTVDSVHDVSQSLQTYESSSMPGVDISGLNIHNNVFTQTGLNAWGYEAIYINTDTGISTIYIENNIFRDNLLRAITVLRDNAEIEDNTIYSNSDPGDLSVAGAYQGINIGSQDNILINNNEIGYQLEKGSVLMGFYQGIKLGANLNNITITNNLITTNETGIYSETTEGVIIYDNMVYGNNTYGINVNIPGKPAASLLDADNNYWGEYTGPYNLNYNPQGAGNAVSDDVNFSHWWTDAAMTIEGSSQIAIQDGIDNTSLEIVNDASNTDGTISMDVISHYLATGYDANLPQQLLTDVRLTSDKAFNTGAYMKVEGWGNTWTDVDIGGMDEAWLSELLTTKIPRNPLYNHSGDVTLNVTFYDLNDTVYNVDIELITARTANYSLTGFYNTTANCSSNNDYRGIEDGDGYLLGTESITLQDPMQVAVNETEMYIENRAIDAENTLSVDIRMEYPTFPEQPQLSSDWLVDCYFTADKVLHAYEYGEYSKGKVEPSEPLTAALKYNGTQVATANLADVQNGYLSEIFNLPRNPLVGHSGHNSIDGEPDVWTIEIYNLDEKHYNINFKSVSAAAGNFPSSAKTSEDSYILAEATEEFLNPIAYAIENSSLVIGDPKINTADALSFDITIDYPPAETTPQKATEWTNIPALPEDLLVDAYIEILSESVTKELPSGVEIAVTYNENPVGTFELTEPAFFLSEALAGQTPNRPALMNETDGVWGITITGLDGAEYEFGVMNIAASSDNFPNISVEKNVGYVYPLGIDMLTIQDPIQYAVENTTVTNTDPYSTTDDKIVFDVSVDYPTAGPGVAWTNQPELPAGLKVDAFIEASSAVPVGTTVNVYYGGSPLGSHGPTTSEEGSWWFSEIISETPNRPALIDEDSDHTWTIELVGLDSAERTFTFSSVASDFDGGLRFANEYTLGSTDVIVQDPIQYAIDNTTMSVSDVTPPSENKGEIEFTVTTVYPTFTTNPVLPVDPENVLNTDCLIESNNGMEDVTVEIALNEGTPYGSTTITGPTSSIWLSEILEQIDSGLDTRTPLVGHTGLTLAWNISITGLDYKEYELDFTTVASNNFVPPSGKVTNGYYELATTNTSFVIPRIELLSLQYSTDDGSSWSSLPASSGTVNGATFDITPDPLKDTYKMDVETLTTNTPIVPGLYGFTLTTPPATQTYSNLDDYTFEDYWAGKGVTSGSTGLNAKIWAAINGDAPLVYLKVTGNAKGSVVCVAIDGPNYDHNGTEVTPEFDGSIFTGSYELTGTITGINGLVSDENELIINVNQSTTEPVFTDFYLEDRVQGQGDDDWIPLTSTPQKADYNFTMPLNPDVDTYEVNLTDNSDTNYDLAPGMYGFYLTYYPDPTTYTWSSNVENVLNGTDPMFYLLVNNDQTMQLVDGITSDPPNDLPFVEILGEYPLGNYDFSGDILGVNGKILTGMTLTVTTQKAEAVELVIDITPDSPVVNQLFDVKVDAVDVNGIIVSDTNMNTVLTTNYDGVAEVPEILQIISGTVTAEDGGICEQALTDLAIYAADLDNPGTGITGELSPITIQADNAPAPPTSCTTPGEGVPELTDPEDNGGWIQICYTMSVDDPFYVEPTPVKNYGVSYYVLERDADPSEEVEDWQFIADIACYDDDSGTNQRTAMINVPASDTAYDYRMASVYNPNKAEFGENHISYKEIENKAGSQSSWANLGSVAADDDLPAYANIKVYLEGPYAGSGLMTDGLATGGYLEGAPANAVDVVTVEVRSLEDGETLKTADVYVSTEGYIISADGERSVPFYYTTDKQYYLVIRHRNHLDIMSSSKHMFSDYPETKTSIDLSAVANVYNSGVKLVETIDETEVYAMYAGDASGNGQIQNDDIYDYWANQVGGSGYLSADFNLNAQVQNNDRYGYWDSNVGAGSQIPDQAKDDILVAENNSLDDNMLTSKSIKDEKSGITFTFANGEFSSGYYDFDVMLSADAAGNKLGSSQIYINYNTLGFGENVVANSNITVTKGTLLEGELVEGSGLLLYQIVNTIDNTNSRFAVATSYDYPTAPASANDIPTTPTQFVHVQLEIVDASQAAGLSFEESLMTGQTYESTNSTTFTVTAEDSDDSTLPVVLSNFTASYAETDGIASMAWTTQSENNNSGWNVYRGDYRDAFIEGEAIQLNSALIPGAGTASQPNYYTYSDPYSQELQGGKEYWYILESVDNSGESYVHGSVALTIPITEAETPLPDATVLKGNYPNPFNPSTTIQFEVKENETGVLSIYNVEGQLVETKKFAPGAHNYEWNSEDSASGVYFYRLKTDSYKQIRKMLLLK